jgi:hypothetical protein
MAMPLRQKYWPYVFEMGALIDESPRDSIA